MKKLLFIALLAFGISARAQIILEHDYDSASTFASGAPAVVSQLMIINFEISGERYVKINKWGKKISIYNLNHALIKIISLDNMPLSHTSGTLGDILYLSEKLFDDDNGMEFMYTTDAAGSGDFANVGIYNDDGTLIFSDSAAPVIKINVPQIQYPIYNTSQGTKMILSYKNKHAKVYSLPGTLSQSIAEANNVLVSQSSVSNPYPNPSSTFTQIDYKLPDGINEGEIVFYDLVGNEVKRFKVDRTFSTLLVSTADIASGTYYYQLQTTAQSSEGKKMVVIR
jgi:hypothetical protein